MLAGAVNTDFGQFDEQPSDAGAFKAGNLFMRLIM